MTLETVTLTLSGDVPLAEFAAAVDSFNDLVARITRHVAPLSGIDWSINQLDVSSAIVTAIGRGKAPEDVERVVRTYDDVGRRLMVGEPVPRYVSRPTRRLLNILNGRVTGIVFETAEEDRIILRGDPQQKIAGVRQAESVKAARTLGAVQGRIQTLSSRAGLRFTLYDTVHDKAVSCYLQEGQEEKVRGLWGELAVVEGFVQRDPQTSRPLSVRQIRRVDRLHERDIGAWRGARGALPWRPDDPPAEEAIRRVRDAW